MCFLVMSCETESLENDSRRRRDDLKALSESKALLVETYVTDARLGRPSYFKPQEKELKHYRLYNSWFLRWGLYLAVLLDLLLVMFEKPAIPGLSVPYWGTMLIELACLIYFVSRVVHGSLFSPDRRKYWRDPKNIVVIILVVLTVLDMLIYIILYNTCCASSVVRGSRVLRPLFVVNLSDFRQIRKAFRNIRKTLPDIITVLILLLLAISLFSLLGYMLFKDKNLHDYKNREYFDSYRDTFFNFYVLVTSANNPDIMMPAYNSSGWYALFFIIFTIICMYVFMSIFLAVVYHNYRKQLKKEVKKSVKRRCNSLSQAFAILKTKVDGQWVVTEQRFREMMHYVAPKRSSAQVKLLWEVLDESSCGHVGQTQFYHVVDLVDVEVVEIKDTVTIFEEYFPRIYNSNLSQLIIKLAKTMTFRVVFDVIIVANAIFIGLDFEDKDEDKGEAVFLVLFNLEIIVKLYAYGFTGFVRRFWNVFDLLVIGAATAAEIIEVGKEAANEDWKPSQTALDVLMVLRVLRLLKIIGSIDRFKNVVRTILQIGPAITTYGALLLILYYVYAIIGMEIFGGLVQYYPPNANSSTDAFKAILCGGHQELNRTEFSELEYCKNNFNYVTRSFVVLFDLMVVNQWHVITQGFVHMTNWSARIYFLSFHLTCVILILNIFVAFILEAFMLQYDLVISKFENAVNKKINELGVGVGMDVDRSVFMRVQVPDDIGLVSQDEVALNMVDVNDQGCTDNTDSNAVGKTHYETVQQLAIRAQTRFRVSSKIQNAEILLQRMFEDELKRDEAVGWAVVAEKDSSSDIGDDDPDDDPASAYYRSTVQSVTAM